MYVNILNILCHEKENQEDLEKLVDHAPQDDINIGPQDDINIGIKTDIALDLEIDIDPNL